MQDSSSKSDEVVLTEYIYTGISGYTYHPVFKNGKWCLGALEGISLLQLASVCPMPDEDISMLMLRYGP